MKIELSINLLSRLSYWLFHIDDITNRPLVFIQHKNRIFQQRTTTYALLGKSIFLTVTRFHLLSKYDILFYLDSKYQSMYREQIELLNKLGVTVENTK